MKLLFVGCGNMGGAIAAGALRALQNLELTVVDPNVIRARALLEEPESARFLADFSSLQGEAFDLTVLSVKPQQFTSLSSEAVAVVGSGAVASIMAGVTIDTIEKTLGTKQIVRTMPNLPALVGEAMTVAYSEESVPEEVRGGVEVLFKSVGEFTWLESEEQINAATAVAGSGPGYIFAFAHYMTEAAKATGLQPDVADLLVRQTFLGAAKMLKEDERSALSLKKAVTSKAGTTEAGLKVFENPTALPEICHQAVEAARVRAIELAEG
ncbi:MAG: pyrroline-5-carboxylate reductase [Rhodobacteraceae bacterium]|nr:pyrroline-5-carboxylate reductase [Paracoccaceae bacterium]